MTLFVSKEVSRFGLKGSHDLSLSQRLILCIALIQRRQVAVCKEWTEEMKSWQRFRWRVRASEGPKGKAKTQVRDLLFWIFTILYCTSCQLYIFLFLASVRQVDSRQWIESAAFGLVSDVLLKPLMFAAILGLLSSLMLCCSPKLKWQLQQKWMPGTVASEDCKATNLDVPEVQEKTPTVLPPPQQPQQKPPSEPAPMVPPTPKPSLGQREGPVDFSAVLPGVPD